MDVPCDIRIKQVRTDFSLLQERERKLREIIDAAASTPAQKESAKTELTQVLEAMWADVVALQLLEEHATDVPTTPPEPPV